MVQVSPAKFDELSTQIAESGNELSLRLLFLDRDDDQHARLLLQKLRSEKLDVDFVSSLPDLIDRLRRCYYRLVIINPALVEGNLTALITGIRQQAPGTEILVVADPADVEAAVAAVKAGAVDCLTRPVPLGRLMEIVGEVFHRVVGVGNLQDISPPSGYRILKTIATGEVSTVVLVGRPGESRQYAMKVLIGGEGGADLANVKRFFREAKILASIDHPNVVKLVEYGFSEKNIPFIIMEYVEGKSLADGLRDAQFDFLRRLIVLEQITKALAVVHGRGVLHRDVRPANVLVTPQFTAKLADFGLAGLADSTLTMARELLGGPSAYLAPEAWEDPKLVDERSDLFSLGVLAYEMFTRQRPFAGKTAVQLKEAVAQQRPPAPHRLNPEVGPELEGVLAKLLAKRPADRWQKAEELVAALRQCHERRRGAGWQLLGAFRAGKSAWQ